MLGLNLNARKSIKERNEDIRVEMELRKKRIDDAAKAKARKNEYSLALWLYSQADTIIYQFGSEHPLYSWALNNIENLWMNLLEKGGDSYGV